MQHREWIELYPAKFRGLRQRLRKGREKVQWDVEAAGGRLHQLIAVLPNNPKQAAPHAVWHSEVYGRATAPAPQQLEDGGLDGTVLTG